MTHFKNDEGSSKDLIAFRYNGITKENLDREIEDFFFRRGYKQAYGQLGDVTYEKGNHTRRILFGAFVKYYKFRIMTNQLENDELGLKVIRATTGLSGGLIGRDQVTNEMIAVKAGLQAI
jgi:hypothetical protein